MAFLLPFQSAESRSRSSGLERPHVWWGSLSYQQEVAPPRCQGSWSSCNALEDLRWYRRSLLPALKKILKSSRLTQADISGTLDGRLHSSKKTWSSRIHRDTHMGYTFTPGNAVVEAVSTGMYAYAYKISGTSSYIIMFDPARCWILDVLDFDIEYTRSIPILFIIFTCYCRQFYGAGAGGTILQFYQ